MIYLITGQPGNGKTLRAMAHMRDEYERNLAAVNAGKEKPRDFFSNVNGATTDENPNAFPWVQRLPEHNDWTLLPDGSYIQYDEAHADGNTRGLERYGLLFPATGKPGESQDPRVRAMSTHRHSGIDLVLITQYPNKIHHQVRTLVGQHIHMNRAMGLSAAGVFTWSRTQVDPYDEQARDKAEEEIWSFPKDLYTRYFSATLHTSSHKFKIPKKVWGGLSMLVVGLLVAWGLYSFLVPDGHGVEKAETPQGQASLLAPAAAPPDTFTVSATGEYASLSAPPVVSLAGCIDTPRSCRCWNTEGEQIDQTQLECRLIVDKPLPFNIYHEYKTGNAPQRIAQRETGTPAIGVVPNGSPSAEQFPRSPGYAPGASGPASQ